MMIDRPGMALVADLLGGAQAGQGGADHDDGRVVVLGVAHRGSAAEHRPPLFRRAQAEHVVVAAGVAHGGRRFG